MIAYHFPPTGGAGVQRSVKFARYLPARGYQPVVVTGPGPSGGRWAPLDATLSTELGDDVEVVRIDGPEPPDSTGSRARAERLLRLTAPFARWWIEGVVAAGIRAAADADVVYASMSPFESATAAARIAAATGLPWVADLRDPWALDEMQIFPSALHRRLELRRMERLLRSADAIVVNTEEARVQLRRQLPALARREVAVIQNGYDASDFNDPPPVAAHPFRIVHTGYLHTELGTRARRTASVRRLLGGGVRGVDILARSHVHLVEALGRIDEEVELHLAGALSAADREVVLRNPRVRLHDYLSHQEAVQLMQTADLLFLPMHGLPPGVRATIVPGKTYEYLASRRPILATVPAGDARELLAAAGGVVFGEPGDVDSTEAAVREAIGRRDVLQEEAMLRPEHVLGAYERRQLSERLAGVFDSVCGAAREPAGVAA